MTNSKDFATDVLRPLFAGISGQPTGVFLWQGPQQVAHFAPAREQFSVYCVALLPGKVRCPQCGCKFEVMPGGATATLGAGFSGGTLQPGAASQGFSGGGSAGLGSAAPSAYSSGHAGLDGPNLTVVAGQPAQSGVPAQAGGARLMDYPKLPVGKVFRQKYRIDAEIGQGGSAVVYRAHDIDADIDVALKVVGVVGGQADGIRRAWAEEYKARRQVADGSHLLGLESPQVEEIDGSTYVALPQELGEKTLRDWLREARSDIEQHREQALRLFTEICKGVEALHNSNLSHLDLKPENIILIQQGQDRLIAKVGDFGLARTAGSLSRREGTGTPAYMAPEQVRSAREKDIGPWSDIYALGCMLFEMLDGDPPFSGNSDELKDKHLNLPPPELEGIPDHLASLVMACLAKSRKERPDTVAAVRTLLEVNPKEEAESRARQQAEEARRREQRRILEPVDIHGWDADRVQDRQRRQAEALGIPVIFRDRLADGSPGPEMVLIPSGIYLMGSPADEPERGDSEGPQHQVTIAKPFAIGRYALTFAEWDAYAAATGGYQPDDKDWGRGARPVINVNWDDAQGYLRWLAGQTKQDYRLPSESEWEYACRAGTTTWFNTGHIITTDQTNFDGRRSAEGCSKGKLPGKTAPVGSYAPNTFSLCEMHGNVYEWMVDCWNESYIGAPTDGSAWMTGDCGRAVLRGGSWDFNDFGLRSAFRYGAPRVSRGDFIGFRVARSVTL